MRWFAIILFAGLQTFLSAEPLQWVWIKGHSDPYIEEVTGMKGVPDPANHPGSRTDALRWWDGDGNLWLYGGINYNSNLHYGPSNDLWKYDRQSQNWTWIAGSGYWHKAPSYSKLGEFSGSNTPGARYDAVNWTDQDGNLWLYGGDGSVKTTEWDMWKFDLQRGQWACMFHNPSFGTPGSHGTQGVPSPKNNPGTREQPLFWKDNEHNLWIMGGNSIRNDLWCFNTNTGLWTWINGSPNYNPPGIYNEIGVPDSDSVPGGRYWAANWTDKDGNFWLYGGNGHTTSTETYGSLNDLWKFDPTARMWTWMDGTKNVNDPANYGTMGIANSLNSPGRREFPMTWVDNSNDFWLFGGTSSRYNNDLWKYDLEAQMWTWVKGSQNVTKTVTHGQLNIPTDSNDPGPRFSGSTWVDNLNNLYIYGGSVRVGIGSKNVYNDIWKISLPVQSGIPWDNLRTY